MNGDYTKVPLRRDERWTAARLQQGRVLLDHDWNLNVDAGARADQAVAGDVIGAAGVVAGSGAFAVGVTPSGPLDLTVGAGRMWVDGLAAEAPAAFAYAEQDQIAPLPASGRVLVYLDVFAEHIQAAEDPSLLDPALAPVDSTARTRVGYRVRAATTTAASCQLAWAALATVSESGGRLTIERVGPAATADPCAPPGDPLGQVPDGLFRVEVLDGGSETTARFAWSFENGGTTVAAVAVAGDTVTLAPSPLRFSVGDRVEVSWLARRADRLDHGALYTIASVTAGAGGDVLALDRAVTAPAAAGGLAVRRWDGEVVGAAAAQPASYRGADLGIRFTGAAGTYAVGDWWGARLRAESGDGIEARAGAAPDGVRHAFAPLALVDLDARAVLSDCRPAFTPLTDLGGSCTVSVKPGDDLQAAVGRLPADGGELCFAAGTYVLDTPLPITGRHGLVLTGAGPATLLRAARREAAIVFQGCTGVEVRHLRAEGGAPGAPPGDPDLEGALTFVSCRDVVVADCALACPDSTDRAQTCVTVRGGDAGPPDEIRIERNRLEVGSGQTGVLVVDPGRVGVAHNHVVLAPGGGGGLGLGNVAVGAELAQLLRASLRERAGAGAKRVAVPGAERPLRVAGEPAARLAADFAGAAKARSVARAGAEKALLRFARGLGAGRGLDALSPASRRLVGDLTDLLRAAGQGIVVGGSQATTVHVVDNIVDGAIQGIHIGVSGDGVSPSIDSVVVARNVVHAVVPASYDRDRHGVFVGNARSVHVLDTVATLRRTAGPAAAPPTPVEGIRVHGVRGPFLAIRHSSLQGFAVGVRVVPLPPEPPARMWVVAETFAEGATTTLDAPPTVDRERNAP